MIIRVSIIINCHRETIHRCSKEYVGSLRVIFLNKSLNCLLFKTLTIYLEYIPLERDFAHYLKNFLYLRTIVNFVHLNQRLKSAFRIEKCPLSVVDVTLNFFTCHLLRSGVISTTKPPCDIFHGEISVYIWLWCHRFTGGLNIFTRGYGRGIVKIHWQIIVYISIYMYIFSSRESQSIVQMKRHSSLKGKEIG